MDALDSEQFSIFGSKCILIFVILSYVAPRIILFTIREYLFKFEEIENERACNVKLHKHAGNCVSPREVLGEARAVGDCFCALLEGSRHSPSAHIIQHGTSKKSFLSLL